MDDDHSLNTEEGRKRFEFEVQQFIIGKTIEAVVVSESGIALVFGESGGVAFSVSGEDIAVHLLRPKTDAPADSSRLN